MRMILAMLALVAGPALANDETASVPSNVAAPVEPVDFGECRAPLCIQDQDLRIEVENLSIRGEIVNVALRYSNVQPNHVVLTQYSIYLRAIAEEGERIDMSTLRMHKFIGQGQQRSDAYSIKFNHPVGEVVDLVFIFENPDASYAFFGLRPEMFSAAGS